MQTAGTESPVTRYTSEHEIQQDMPLVPVNFAILKLYHWRGKAIQVHALLLCVLNFGSR